MTPHDYVDDLISHLERVLRYTSEGREAFLTDERTQDAVIRVYEVVGEIAKRLSQDIRDKALEIDWRKLIAFRDFIAHSYDEVVLEFVWAAVEDAPRLIAACRALHEALE